MNFLTIILLIYTTTYGSYNNSYSNYSDRSNGVSTQQISRIGYTTRYGNSFGQSTNYYTVRRTELSSPLYREFHTSVYTPTSTCSSGPRKSAQRPYSGGAWEDFIDWLRMNTDSNWPSYVDEDYWEEFISQYPEYEDEAREWYENRGKRFPGDPEDPYPTPLGDFPIGLVIAFILIYCIYTLHKRKSE